MEKANPLRLNSVGVGYGPFGSHSQLENGMVRLIFGFLSGIEGEFVPIRRDMGSGFPLHLRLDVSLCRGVTGFGPKSGPNFTSVIPAVKSSVCDPLVAVSPKKGWGPMSEFA